MKITVEHNVRPYGFQGISRPVTEVFTLDLGHDDVSLEYLYEAFDRLALMLGFHPESVEEMQQRGEWVCACDKDKDEPDHTRDEDRTAWDGVYAGDK